MIMSQLAVLPLTLVLVCCGKRIDRTEPTPLYPLRGTVVDSIRGEHRVPVDSVGGFTLLLPAGHHHVCAEAIGFISRAGIVVLPRDSSRVLTLSMPWKPIPLGY